MHAYAAFLQRGACPCVYDDERKIKRRRKHASRCVFTATRKERIKQENVQAVAVQTGIVIQACNNE